MKCPYHSGDICWFRHPASIPLPLVPVSLFPPRQALFPSPQQLCFWWGWLHLWFPGWACGSGLTNQSTAFLQPRWSHPTSDTFGFQGCRQPLNTGTWSFNRGFQGKKERIYFICLPHLRKTTSASSSPQGPLSWLSGRQQQHNTWEKHFGEGWCKRAPNKGGTSGALKEWDLRW